MRKEKIIFFYCPSSTTSQQKYILPWYFTLEVPIMRNGFCNVVRHLEEQPEQCSNKNTFSGRNFDDHSCHKGSHLLALLDQFQTFGCMSYLPTKTCESKAKV